MNFEDRYTQDARRCILQILTEQNRYSANSSILVAALKHLGYHLTHDQVKNNIIWLAENALVNYSRLPNGWLDAEVTRRGMEVGEGTARVEGVSRPEPI